jgi:hypothetical protein
MSLILLSAALVLQAIPMPTTTAETLSPFALEARGREKKCLHLISSLIEVF